VIKVAKDSARDALGARGPGKVDATPAKVSIGNTLSEGTRKNRLLSQDVASLPSCSRPSSVKRRCVGLAAALDCRCARGADPPSLSTEKEAYQRCASGAARGTDCPEDSLQAISTRFRPLARIRSLVAQIVAVSSPFKERLLRVGMSYIFPNRAVQ
jgi:hypothetical protein